MTTDDRRKSSISATVQSTVVENWLMISFVSDK